MEIIYNGKKIKSLSGLKKIRQEKIDEVIDYKQYLKKNPNPNPNSKRIFNRLIKENYKEINLYGQKIKNFKQYKEEVKKYNEYKDFLKKFNVENEVSQKKRKQRIINNYGSIKNYKKAKEQNYYLNFSLYIDKEKTKKLRRDLKMGYTIRDDRDDKLFNIAMKDNILDFEGIFISANKFLQNVIYRQDINANIFNKFINYIKKDKDIKISIANIEQSNLITAFVIHQISKHGNKKYVKPKLFDNVNYEDDEHNMICSKYTQYKANLEASNFKDLIIHEHNDYLKLNFRPNSCIYTCIINKFYERFNRKDKKGVRKYKELTYDFLINLCEIENKPTNNGVSINIIIDKFFKKYKFLGLKIYNQFMQLIRHHESTDKDNTVLSIILCNNHVYELNDNLNSLCQKIDYSDDERSTLKISSKFLIMKPIDNIIEVYCLEICDILNEIKKYIQQNTIETPITKVKIISNTSLSDVLFHLYDSGYSPNVNFITSLTKIIFEINKISFEIIPADNLKENGQLITFNSIEDYAKYQKANSKFYEKIFNPEHMSHYHPSSLIIDKQYSIYPMVGRFNNDIELNKRNMDIIDESKAYTQCAMTIAKIPIFNFFDVYQKYNNETIEDYNYYIIEVLENNMKSLLLFGSKICKTYGFVLKNTTIKYNILQFKKPHKVVDVNYKKHIDELYENKNISTEYKKAISNITTGLLEKGKNQKTLSKIFKSYNEAKYYAIKYDGKILILLEPWKHDIENNKAIMGEKKLYVVKVSEEKELIEGFKPIKDIIYCNQRLKMLKLYEQLILNNIKVYGIRTDCFYIETGKTQKDMKNINFGSSIGQYKHERGKMIPDNLLKMKENEIITFQDFNCANIKTFKDEWNTKKINNYLNKHKNVFIEGDYPGVGKTQICKNYDKKALFVCPYNKLCQNMRKDNLESMTYSKAFGLYADDKEIANKISLDEYKTVIFDEAFLYSPDRLKRLADMIYSHPDIHFIGTGDGLQRSAIGFSDDAYIQKCINIMFPNRILLKEIKRLVNKKDIQVWKDIKIDIFENNMKVEDICKKHNINTINKMKDVITTTNVALFNGKCETVNSHVRTNILKQQNEYFEGMEIIKNGKYFKGLYTNFTYKLKTFNVNKLVFVDEVENNEVEIDVQKISKKDNKYTSKGILERHFKHPYCSTIDSIQGLSFGPDEKMTIFDSNHIYTNKKYFWTALTRARKIKNITVFIHSKEEIKFLETLKIEKYFNNKINGYKIQDDNKNRVYENNNFVNVEWLTDKMGNMKNNFCKCCSRQLYIYVDYDEEKFDDNIKSNITIDRIDSKIAHLKNNCQILCSSCTSSKGNIYVHKF